MTASVAQTTTLRTASGDDPACAHRTPVQRANTRASWCFAGGSRTARTRGTNPPRRRRDATLEAALELILATCSSISPFSNTGVSFMSNAPIQASATAGQASWLDFVRRHPLTSFFLLAFGLTWAIMVPQVLGSYGLIPFPEFIPLLIVMGYGPTFAALIMTGALGGRPAVKELLRRLLIW